MRITRRYHVHGLLALAGLEALPACAQESAKDNGLIGTWTGRLDAGVAVLRLRFVITDDKTAKVISLDQGNAEIPATSVEINGNRVRLQFRSIQATYEGELKEGKLKDGDRIEGTFTQGAPMPLVLHRGETVPEAAPVAALTLERLKALRFEAGVPALAAGWQARGAAPVVLADGLRAAGSDAAVTAQDRFHWGSNTKSMTATVAARLVEQGKIGWDTTVGEILSGEAMQDGYKTVTLLHLLSHHSGLKPNLDLPDLVTYQRDELPDARAERRKYALAALNQPLAAKPGSSMIYSNNGFIVAGVLLETVAGKPWETLIREELFTPLNLKTAGFGAPGTPDRIDQPLGHAVQGTSRTAMPVGPGKINDNPTALGPAGRVHMSLPDMLTYLRLHADQPEAYLKPETWKKLHTPPFTGNYALGWIVRPDGSLWHNGSNTLWYAECAANPATGAVACAAANDASPPAHRAVGQALVAALAGAVA